VRLRQWAGIKYGVELTNKKGDFKLNIYIAYAIIFLKSF
jgi:hypothetical protein